ncbi:hypothetical protein K1719_030044 [Acacia pycnantha]|nr:hypothetical protein K1719_030044 [Acacia pycnantha]
MALSSQFSAIRHEVFISFRGTDTRHGFLSHLRKELRRKQIEAYADDRLERGDKISQALLRAIKESLISLLIFSKDYASSRLCLEELVQIIECMENQKQIVIPVFYNIDPSHVRHQKGSYGDALAKHDEYYKEKVSIWRSALNKAANLSGFHYSSNYEDEAEFIEKIATTLSTRLNLMYKSDFRDLVGIDERIADLESLMDQKMFAPLEFGVWAVLNNDVDLEWIVLSRKVSSYAKGIPLALKVLGSFLYGKSREEWESQLEKLKKMPYAKIQDVMRLSYDDLDREEKNIFLYIACFLKGYESQQIIVLLNSCGFSTIIGLRVLRDKSLITEVSYSRKSVILMHDLIQEMGREIVCEESIDNPGKRSRLWDANDISQVLEHNTGTKTIQSISLNVAKIEGLCLTPQVFSKMTELKLLKFSQHNFHEQILHLPQGLDSLPNELRFFEWVCYPLRSLPSSFCPKSLVELKMTWSRVEKLWDGVLDLVNLKKIDLSYSKNLLDLPDFSMAENLEEVELYSCKSMLKLPGSIKHLQQLEKLDFSNCRRLHSLPELPPSIKELHATNCTSLKKVMMIFSMAFDQLREQIRIRSRFQNCVNLDEHSLRDIAMHSHVNIKRLAYEHLSTLGKSNIFLGGPIDVIYPGSNVPDWFMNRTRQSSVTMDLSSSLPSVFVGFIFCAVVSRFPSNDKNFVGFMEADESNNMKILFEFFAQTGNTWEKKRDIGIKECGVYPIYDSEYHTFIEELESNSQLRAIEEDKDEEEAIHLARKPNQHIITPQTSKTWEKATLGLKDLINL